MLCLCECGHEADVKDKIICPTCGQLIMTLHQMRQEHLSLTMQVAALNMEIRKLEIKMAHAKAGRPQRPFLIEQDFAWQRRALVKEGETIVKKNGRSMSKEELAEFD